MSWLKKNWFTVLTSLIALICGGDITAGMIQGKSLNNVTMIPSLFCGTGALGTILFRWLNNRTVTTRVAPAGLDADVQRMLEAIYTVASSPDVTPDMITDLSNMAAASVIGHANRVKAAAMPGRVEVLPVKAEDFMRQQLEWLKQQTEVKS